MSARRVLQLVTLAVSCGACGVLGEWIWRAAVRQRYQSDRQAFDQPLYVLADEPELYDLRPEFDRIGSIADPAGGPPTVVRTRILPEQLRWHANWPPPDGSAVRRVLFIGDSFTFGTAVDDGVSYPHQVEELLVAAGEPCFAINAGVPGYNSEQQLARLRRLLPQYAPQHVVVGFVMNDAEPPIGVVLPPTLVYGDAWSWLLEDGKQLGNALVTALIDDRPAFRPRRPEMQDYRISFAAGSAKAAACEAAVAAMHEACRALGVGFTVAVLPDTVQPLDDRYPYEPIHAQVVAWGRRHGFVVVDTLAGMRGLDVTQLRVPGDLHPNRQGHHHIAVQVAATLQEQWRD